MKTERNILIAFILNLVFSIIEFIGGTIIGSVAIVSDAIHDLGDSISTLIAFILEKVSKKGINEKYTYGYVRYSIIGSMITSSILLAGSIIVIYNAINRIINPVSINYNGMIILAIIGFIINLIASYITKEGESLNQKAVNLHMLEDVLGWAIVLIGAIIMKFTDISLIDPILSIIVSLFILFNVCKNIKLIMNVILEKTPDNINLDEIKEHISKIKGIKEIHHIHVWSLDGYRNYATMHVVVDKVNKDIKDKIKEELLEHNIDHVTIELEDKFEVCENNKCKANKKSSHNHHH